MGGAKVCGICCVVLLVLTFSIWLDYALQTNTPSCSIKELYIPALDTRLPIFNTSAPAATFIFFDLQLDNHIKTAGVGFEYMNPTLTFYYTGFPVANFTLPRFSQGEDDEAHLRDLVETRGMPWSDALAAVSGGFTATFTLEFSARVKVNQDLWHTYTELLLRGDVEVNDSGEKLQKKDIKLVPFVKSISNTLTSLLSDE
ncbi:hypothetical protein ACS0TY_032664 [Phlomoides rotata]